MNTTIPYRLRRGAGGRPGGPQKSAGAVPGRRPAVLALFGPTSRALVSDANLVGVTVVQLPLRRSWAILVSRSFELQGRTVESRRP